MNERKDLLNMLRVIWRKGDSPLRRIYSSWEELEANVDIRAKDTAGEEQFSIQLCPHCDVEQRIAQPLEDIFPYQTCQSCKRPFYVNNNLTVRALTGEEKEDAPETWFRVLEDLNHKKMAIVFGLE